MTLPLWSASVSAVFLVLAVALPEVAGPLTIAFVAALLYPAIKHLTKERPYGRTRRH